MALLFAADGMDRDELRRILRTRRDMLAIKVAQLIADREQLVARGHVDALAAAVIQRAAMHAETEIRWHEKLDASLGAAWSAGTPDRPDGAPSTSLNGSTR